jgi:hypothetical protein
MRRSLDGARSRASVEDADDLLPRARLLGLQYDGLAIRRCDRPPAGGVYAMAGLGLRGRHETPDEPTGLRMYVEEVVLDLAC